MHFIENVALSVLLSVAFFLGVNLILLLAARGGARALWFAFRIRRWLRNAPSKAILECRGRTVSVLRYDRAADQESSIAVYVAPNMSPLAWSTGPRSVKSLRGRADVELALTTALLLLLTILFAAGLWLAFAESWMWLFAVAVFLTAQIVQAKMKQYVVLKYQAFSSIIPVALLHRYDLYPLNVTYALVAFFAIVSIASMPWIYKVSGR